MTGALIDAQHALRMGLAQEVAPEGQALGRALEIAGALSTYPPLSMQNDRRAAVEGLTLPIEEGLVREAALHRDSLTDPRMAEGLRRYASGDRPQPLRPPPGT